MKKSDPQISIFNRQRKIPIQTLPLKDFLYRVTRKMGFRAGFSVALVSDSAIRRYNLSFRGKDRATDVLSFPNPRETWEIDQPYLGDILISVERADRQKVQSLLGEVKALSLHGILHLLGHDHEKDQGQMESLERKLRKEFRLN